MRINLFLSALWVPPLAFFLNRKYFPMDTWLDTFQVRVRISEFGVCAAFGALGAPPAPKALRPPGVPGSRCGVWACGEAARVCHVTTWPQARRLRYKDKYKYYSQNLCINKYFWGILGRFIFWKIVSSTNLILRWKSDLINILSYHFNFVSILTFSSKNSY